MPWDLVKRLFFFCETQRFVTSCCESCFSDGAMQIMGCISASMAKFLPYTRWLHQAGSSISALNHILSLLNSAHYLTSHSFNALFSVIVVTTSVSQLPSEFPDHDFIRIFYFDFHKNIFTNLVIYLRSSNYTQLILITHYLSLSNKKINLDVKLSMKVLRVWLQSPSCCAHKLGSYLTVYK